MSRDTKVKYPRAYGKECIGSKRHGTDIMISMYHEDSNGGSVFDDYHLTTDQANSLVNEISDRLDQNKQDDEE